MKNAIKAMKLICENFFDLNEFDHRDLFAGSDLPWAALKHLKEYLAAFPYPDDLQKIVSRNSFLQETVILHDRQVLPATECAIEFGDATKGKLMVSRNGRLLPGASVIMAGAVLMGDKIKIGTGVLIETGAMVKEPAVIGDQTEVRQGAYLRGNCLVGRRCVVGHVTEMKHAILFDDAKAGHFAYLGDSILGNHVNLGAGTKLANLKFSSGEVLISTPDGMISTGLRKFGAILGDRVQTGCNSVTNPGTILGKKSVLLPNRTAPSGYHRAGTIIR